MSLNKTGIEYVDYTHNILTGCWGPGGSRESPKWCPFCYAKRFAERYKGSAAFPNGFIPTFYPERCVEFYKLKPPRKSNGKPWIAKVYPNNWLIFEGSMGDVFGDWVPESWTGNILCTIANCHDHIFLISTKCHKNLVKWKKFFPANLWIGVSVTSQKDIERIFYLNMTDARIKYISFEPLLNSVETDLKGIDWIILGAQTQPKKFPRKEWVNYLINQARKRDIPVFLKDNLNWPEKIQEFPGQ